MAEQKTCRKCYEQKCICCLTCLNYPCKCCPICESKDCKCCKVIVITRILNALPKC